MGDNFQPDYPFGQEEGSGEDAIELPKRGRAITQKGVYFPPPRNRLRINGDQASD